MQHTIFSMVVDAVIRNWVTVMVGEEAGPEGLGEQLRCSLRSSYPEMDSFHNHGKAGFKRSWTS